MQTGCCHMILELAQIDIKQGLEKEFEAGVRKSVPSFERSKGFQSLQIRRVVETPGRYHLLVRWETLENHTVDFFGSEAFAEWRRLVGHCFVALPPVEHSIEVFSFRRQEQPAGTRSEEPTSELQSLMR